MSGLATCEILRREFEVHGDARFERLAGISRSHVYNLRASRAYRTRRTTREKTRPSPVAVAVRKRRSRTAGRASCGSTRCIWATRTGARACTSSTWWTRSPSTSTSAPCRASPSGSWFRFSKPSAQVLGFHADNGSEYVNHRVAALLNKLHVGEFTKSRPRHFERQERPRRHLGAHPRRFGDRRPRAPELPPPLPVRHRARRRQGQGAANLPRTWRSSSRCRTGTARLSTPSPPPGVPRAAAEALNRARDESQSPPRAAARRRPPSHRRF